MCLGWLPALVPAHAFLTIVSASTPARPPPAPRPPGCQPQRAPRRRPWYLLGWHRACAHVCLRSCLCIPKPILGVQAWPGLARQRFSVWTCFRAPGSCPGASSLVVYALGWCLLCPRWMPCWLICAWCTGGTRCWFDVCVVSSLAACIAP